ncbi:alpha/beta-hydrolase [Roridomyces roridus]|uniref:Alpha/beta-hydrolase n=1 Tax=Roridomyces roridus TaxID=1738132 RepID=A0AAD7BRM7_9AGAR|nr:alpha/beta-hydrolase [Roridomyces roridus]
MQLTVSSFVFTCPQDARSPQGTFLKMTAKRYSTKHSSSNSGGLTLLFGHGVGAHKEIWEPVIEDIFAMDKRRCIREAWAMDRQDHGDAALLNAEEIARNRKDGVYSYEWSRAIAAFASSPRMRGHRIVTISHSAGAISMVGSTKFVDLERNPFVAMILVEPSIVAAELDPYTEGGIGPLTSAIRIRRDTWDSREAAHKWMQTRFPWNMWDPRVLRAHIDHGFKDTPEGKVTLKCDKSHEANAFLDKVAHFDSVDQVGRICSLLPLHIIWGDRDDIIPEAGKGSISDRSQGRVAASVTKMEGGHMLVQETPTELALELCRLFETIAAQHVDETLVQSRL